MLNAPNDRPVDDRLIDQIRRQVEAGYGSLELFYALLARAERDGLDLNARSRARVYDAGH